MRIVLHSRYPESENHPRGGVESATVNLLYGLKALGNHELHVVTLDGGIAEPIVEERDLVTVHRLPASRWPMVLDIFWGPGRRRLQRYISSLNPDIVHFQETHGLAGGPWPWPSLFTLHGFDSLNLPTERSRAWKLRSKVWAWAEKKGLSRHRHIISIARYVSDQIRGSTRAQITDIPNAIRSSGFELIRDEEATRVFFAGWINPRKNAVGLVRAFAKVVEQQPNATLRLAGEFSDADYKSLVVSEIHQLGLDNSVSLLGRIDAAAMQEELSKAAVFVLPSFQENAPMVISESMAAGIPVVTSNVCGMPDMVAEGETGFLVNPESTDEIADRVLRVIQDDELRRDFSSKARAMAYENYHPESVARRTCQLYADVISDFRKTHGVVA